MSGASDDSRPGSPPPTLPAWLVSVIIDRLDREPRAAVEADLVASHPDEQAGIRAEIERLAGAAAGEARVFGSEFEVVAELGRGGMGIVYVARQRSLGRLVALKVLPRALAFDQTVVERFKRELEVLARLRHDGIVRVIDAGDDGGQPFIAMELVCGPDLGAVLGSLRQAKPEGGRGPAAALSLADLSRAIGRARAVLAPGTEPATVFELAERRRGYVEEVVERFADLCDALAHAHTEGVVHRDIKPQNILVDPHGHLRLVDFGLARAPDGQSLSVSFAGTPAYMSPEQVLAGRVALDHRTDVYSLAATLYEMLTLRPPFTGESMHKLFRAIQWDQPPPMLQLNPALPRDLVAVVDKAMAKNPDRRYPDAAAFGADLRRVLRFEAVSAKGLSRWSRAAQRLRKHRLAALFAGASVVGAGGVWLVGDRIRASEVQALEAERGKSRQQWLDRFGRAEALRQLGRLAAAEQELDGTAPAGLEAELDQARHAVATAIDRQLAAALGVGADATAEQLDDAVLGLEPLLRARHRGAEIAALHDALRSRARALREVALFEAPRPADRLLAIRAWAADRRAGLEISPARQDAFGALLDTERDVEVLAHALAAVVPVFEDHERRLRERAGRERGEIAFCLVVAAAFAGRDDWLAEYRAHAPEWTDLSVDSEAWEEFCDSDAALSPWRWQLDYSLSARSATGAWLAEVLPPLTRYLLRDPRLWEDLRTARSGRPLAFGFEYHGQAVIAYAQLEDDPELGAVIRDRLDPMRTELDGLLWAWRLLAVWGSVPPATVLDRAVAAPNNDSAAASVSLLVAAASDQPEIEAWAIARLRDPLVDEAMRTAVWAGLLGYGAAPPGAALVPLPAELDTRAEYYEWLPRRRGRGELAARVRAALAGGPTAAWAGGLPAAASAARNPRPAAARSEPLHRAVPRVRIDLLRRAASAAATPLAERRGRLVTALGDRALPVRRAAALLLADLGAAAAAEPALREARARYGRDALVERALLRAAIERGDESAAAGVLGELLAYWEPPAGFLDDDVYAPVRARVEAGR